MDYTFQFTEVFKELPYLIGGKPWEWSRPEALRTVHNPSASDIQSPQYLTTASLPADG